MNFKTEGVHHNDNKFTGTKALVDTYHNPYSKDVIGW